MVFCMSSFPLLQLRGFAIVVGSWLVLVLKRIHFYICLEYSHVYKLLYTLYTWSLKWHFLCLHTFSGSLSLSLSCIYCWNTDDVIIYFSFCHNDIYNIILNIIILYILHFMFIFMLYLNLLELTTLQFTN